MRACRRATSVREYVYGYMRAWWSCLCISMQFGAGMRKMCCKLRLSLPGPNSKVVHESILPCPLGRVLQLSKRQNAETAWQIASWTTFSLSGRINSNATCFIYTHACIHKKIHTLTDSINMTQIAQPNMEEETENERERVSEAEKESRALTVHVSCASLREAERLT
jgi:hypothetical protein